MHIPRNFNGQLEEFLSAQETDSRVSSFEATFSEKQSAVMFKTLKLKCTNKIFQLADKGRVTQNG